MKCPKCNKEIDHLHNIQTMWHRFDMVLTKKGFPKYDNEKTWEADENSFACPECDEDLFWTEKNAKKFLKTGHYQEEY